MLLVRGQEAAEAPAGVHVEVEVEQERLAPQAGGERHRLRQQGVRAVRVQDGSARRGQQGEEHAGGDRGVGDLGGAVPSYGHAVLPGAPRGAAGAEPGGDDAYVVAFGEAPRQVLDDAFEAAEMRWVVRTDLENGAHQSSGGWPKRKWRVWGWSTSESRIMSTSAPLARTRAVTVTAAP